MKVKELLFNLKKIILVDLFHVRVDCEKCIHYRWMLDETESWEITCENGWGAKHGRYYCQFYKFDFKWKKKVGRLTWLQRLRKLMN